MEQRMFYIGKVKRKEIEKDFDTVYEKYRKRALEKGYENPKLKILKEKSIVKFYVLVDLEDE